MPKGPKVNPSTMLWFIRSRSYMPVHEIRRRFMIEGDDATVVYDQHGPVYMGLPDKPANVLMELSKQGKVGLECSAEFESRVLLGVFPMNPAREENTLRPAARVQQPGNGGPRPRPAPSHGPQPAAPINGSSPAPHAGARPAPVGNGAPAMRPSAPPAFRRPHPTPRPIGAPVRPPGRPADDAGADAASG